MNTESTAPSGAGLIARTYADRPLTLVRGEGVRVWDSTGKGYLDFTGGVAVNSLGHCHPAVRSALMEQSGLLLHTSNLFYNEPQCRLAEKLVRLIGSGVVFFCNSGAEANEALIKLARKWGSSSGRFEIITTEGSFHGRTMAGISATGQDKVKVGFEPLLPGFVHVPFNDLSAVAAALTDRTAAVLVEGIQGEGGVIEARPDYLMGLREITRKAGCLLLWDGVQCGGFRCGDFQSYTRILAGQMGADTFLPDGIAMAKSLGSGFPIGATWIREPYAGVLGPGSHGSTYGGNALACAVACAVLDEIETKHWGSHIIQIGDELKKRLRRDLGNGVVAVRGCGGLIGVEVKGDMPALRMKLLDHGLLLAPAARNTLRWLPPLNVRWEDVEEALAIWNQCL